VVFPDGTGMITSRNALMRFKPVAGRPSTPLPSSPDDTR
jgi:hypothetical protein